MMNNKTLYYLEILIIFIHWSLILFSIIIQPLVLVLGIICMLFLPGYNLISILKPKFNFIQRWGYSTITSLTIINIFMFISYVLLFNLFTKKTMGFHFEAIFLISSIQITNLILISIQIFKNNSNFKRKFNLKRIKEKLNFKILILFSIFCLSLFFLCLSAYYSDVPNNSYSESNRDYWANFTFFIRVPFYFYIFLVISILSLTSIVFLSNNKYLILISLFLFMYTLWILPYLQIKNFFENDSYLNYRALNIYHKKGISADKEDNFIFSGTYIRFRYTVTIFTAIILMESTHMESFFVLWFIFPLIYISLPFFIYSIFEKYAIGNNKQNLSLTIITIIALFIGQFAKNPHAATTKPISTFTFFILIFELYDFMTIRDYKLKFSSFILISGLFFFLSLSHFEETVYFIILVVTFNFVFLFLQFRKIRKGYKLANSRSNLKLDLIINGFLIFVLLIIFYFIQEFFNYIELYLRQFIGNFPLISFILDFYLNRMNITLPLLNGGFSYNIMFVVIIIISVILYILGCYLFIFKMFSLVSYVFKIIFNFLRKIHDIIQFFVNKKYKRSLFFSLLFILTLTTIFFILIFVEQVLQLYGWLLLEGGYIIILDLVLNYTIVYFHIFLFLNGVCYYEKDDINQNYYILSILASATIMVILFLGGEILLAYYILNARFLSFFMFLNLIIIQNTYFKDFLKKKKKNLAIFVIVFLFFGTFYSLRKLAAG
ncbi:MAG: hypothetical protein ACFFDN_21390 [Candidatus Hodarchaeota archaeon]